ncbi:MAG: 3-dehydroquinate synthase, partial [Candidatus Omnitrophica bacterium]|nr:3-dehydroquinate synthase [Candidatus Omnitrophota bacterium]
MMKQIWVKSSGGRYPVFIGRNLIGKVGPLMKRGWARNGFKSPFESKIMIVTQDKVARYHLQELRRSFKRAGFKVVVHVVPDGEKTKSEKQLFRLYRGLVKNDFERRDTLVALGGGVVGDLVGFAASTYLRGIAFVNVGTTLLAQVDSSIGGKTGINLAEGKNLVGTFYPPKMVVSDIDVLATLPDREFRASMAEVVKYGVIRDARLFRLLELRGHQIMARNSNALFAAIEACARIKADVVSRDEKEVKGERMILNYGHTFGHALEQVTGYQKMMHGEAVALGMICAARLAVYLGILSGDEETRQARLISRFGLPVSMSRFRLVIDDLLRAMMRDKKKSAGHLRYVLPEGI